MREKKKKRTGQSEIPVAILVEQKIGILAVLPTPLIELPIQKSLKSAKKIKAENVSRETFLLQPQRNNDWANRPTMHDTSIMKRCITIGYTTHRTRSR